MTKNERTLKMMDEYVDLFFEGFNAIEISKKYNLHYTTVYGRLEEIAKRNGLERDQLLRQPNRKHEYTRKENGKEDKEKRNFQEMQQWMEEILRGIKR